MSFETLLWVRTQRTGNVASRSVLRVLADHAGQDHSCYLRTRTIAAETDLSEAGVRKALARLIEAGMIRIYERYKNDGARISNRYQLLVEGADTPAPDAEDWAGERIPPISEVEDPRQDVEGDPRSDGEGFPSKETCSSETPIVKGTARPKTATRIPDDFPVTEHMKDWFAAEKLHEAIANPRAEHEKFCDYWRSIPGARGRKLDWFATWRNWMRTAAERAPRRPGTALAPTSGAPYQPAANSTTNARVMQGLALAEKFRQMEESE